MKMWSVELEANSWNDDTFNGSFEECVEYCEEYEYKIGKECRLAEIEVNEEGSCTYIYQFVYEL